MPVHQRELLTSGLTAINPLVMKSHVNMLEAVFHPLNGLYSQHTLLFVYSRCTGIAGSLKLGLNKTTLPVTRVKVRLPALYASAVLSSRPSLFPRNVDLLYYCCNHISKTMPQWNITNLCEIYAKLAYYSVLKAVRVGLCFLTMEQILLF